MGKRSRIDADVIVTILQQVSGDVSSADLLEQLQAVNQQVSQRTVQRHLNRLIDAGRIVQVGEGRSTRYRVAERDGVAGDAGEPSSLFLSPTSARLRSDLLSPIHARQPVGYRREFLGDYQPNRTFYLPTAMRERLQQISRGIHSISPAETYLQQIYHRLLIDLSWNSSRLEGNTYSLLETERLLNSGIRDGEHSVEEAQMILNHKAAIEFLVRIPHHLQFTTYSIFGIHSLLAHNLLADQRSLGRLRSRAVGIGQSVYLPPDGEKLLEELFGLFLEKVREIDDPFEQSFFCIVHLPYLQPFEDGNKRVSRLVANLPLIQHRLSPLSFVDLPREDYTLALLAVYELNRIEYLRELYLWAYERSAARYSAVRMSMGEPDPFRLQYREEIFDTVQAVVKSGKYDETWLRTEGAAVVPSNVRSRFVDVVQSELHSLHIGNIARYALLPSEFEAWEGYSPE